MNAEIAEATASPQATDAITEEAETALRDAATERPELTELPETEVLNNVNA